MSLRNRWFVLVVVALALVLSCKKKDTLAPLTVGEAQEALEESKLSTQAEMLVGSTIEIATNFTIGQAVETAAQELRDFIASQLPCASITLSGHTLSIEYGVNPGNCTYNGHTFTGSQSITVTRNNSGDVEVDHSWTDLSNGVVSVTGTATVTWSLAQGSRHVVHELDWTRLADHKTATGSGDREQTALSGGIAEGIEVNGSRSWDEAAGTWDLAIDGVEIRWLDPVPQAGSYTLVTPAGKTLSMSFTRVNATTISVTIKNGDKEYSFDVTSVS